MSSLNKLFHRNAQHLPTGLRAGGLVRWVMGAFFAVLKWNKAQQKCQLQATTINNLRGMVKQRDETIASNAHTVEWARRFAAERGGQPVIELGLDISPMLLNYKVMNPKGLELTIDNYPGLDKLIETLDAQLPHLSVRFKMQFDRREYDGGFHQRLEEIRPLLAQRLEQAFREMVHRALDNQKREKLEKMSPLERYREERREKLGFMYRNPYNKSTLLKNPHASPQDPEGKPPIEPENRLI